MRKSLDDIASAPMFSAPEGVLGQGTLGREALRLAQLAAALHLSQAAPLLAGARTPDLWMNSDEGST